ncbi:mono-functional DNA-alkylating methyl methanesulfonate N-term-domain-containing protein [Schizophyllum fasciatum]
MAAKTVKLVTTFHAPSSVIASVKCKLTPGDVEHLVVAKMSRLEVFSLQPEGLCLESTLDIWGSVCSVKAVGRTADDCDRLVVMLDHPQPELLFFDYDGAALALAHALDLSTANALQRAAEFCMDFFVNEMGTRLVASAYAGKVKVVCLEDGLPTDTVYDASTYENNILSICFVPGAETDNTIAILHIDATQRVRLIARDLETDEWEIAARPSLELPYAALNAGHFRYADEDPLFLLPVPEEEGKFRGGVLIVGGRRITLYERADVQAKERRGKKRDTLEARLKEGDSRTQREAKEKQKERELRKRKPQASVDWPWSPVAACEALDERRFLIGDEYGRLGLVHFDFRGTFPCLMLVPLGMTSPPKSITHLNGSKAYIGSHYGDSQIIDIGTTIVPSSAPLPIPNGWPTVKPEELEAELPSSTMDPTQPLPDAKRAGKGKIVQMRGSVLSVTESHTNIAPIVDAALVDVDDSGQPQVVTCSGDKGAGRLHVVRSGADFEILASAENPGAAHISGIWPLKNMYDDAEHAHILFDTPEGTQLFRVDNTDAQPALVYERPEDASLLSARTLAAGNVRVSPDYADSPMVVQVTTEGLRVCEYRMELAGYTLLAGHGVQGGGPPTAACVAESQIFVAYPKGRLFYFCVEAQNGEYRLKEVGYDSFINLAMDAFANPVFRRMLLRDESEIAAIAVLPPEPKAGKLPKSSKYIAVAYWDRPGIDILKLRQSGGPSGVVAECTHTTDALPALVRGLTVQHFGGQFKERHTYLIAGLANGAVVTYALRDGVTRDRKVVSLGSAPVSLTVYHSEEGEPMVFAAGQHAALWSWEKKRLHHAAVMLRDIAATAFLTTPKFKDALVLASRAGLTVGRVREVDKMHIRTIPLGGYTPKGIVHDAANRLFGVIAFYTPPVSIGIDTEPRTNCAFVLFDDSTFEEVQRYKFADGTVPTAITLLQRPADEGTHETFFCVATYDAALSPEDGDGEPGTLHLLSVSRTSNADGPAVQVAERAKRQVISCVTQLTTVKGLIAAAVESTVVFFRPDVASVSSSTWAMNKVGEWTHNFVVRTLATRGNHIAIGDQMHSISLVKVAISSNDTVQLELISCDFSPLFPASLALGENDAVITANVDMNLSTFSATASNGRDILDRDGAFYLGELVNKFIPGALSSAETAGSALKPSYVFFTSVGRIGVIVDIHGGGSLSRLFTDLERNMSHVFRGVGVEKGAHEDHLKHRAPKNSIRGSDAESARGFVDGDFLEQLLTLDKNSATLRKVIEGKTVHEKIRQYSVDEIHAQLETLQSLH